MNTREPLSLSRRLLLASLAAVPLAAKAQGAWPSRPIRLVVPAAAGLSIDNVARMIAERMAQRLGQPVVVDNKPGAAGIIGTAEVAKSAPDGYTLSFNTASVMSINPHVYPLLPYDVLQDFVPVVHTSTLAFVLVTAPIQPFRNFEEFLSAAKSQPGKINYASLGSGSSAHVLMEMLDNMAGTKTFHVPYKGSFLSDVMAGQVHVAWEPTTTTVPLANAGRLRALAVGSTRRNPALPDVPAVAEFLPGFEGDTWHGIFAPSRTPADVVARLNTEIVRIVREPDIQRRLSDLGLQPVGSTQQEFDALVKSDYRKWGEVVKRNNIRAG